MEIQFLWYPKCTTCQKAKKWLDENGIAYIARDIKQENPSYSELKQWYHQGELPLKKLFNTSGILYKEMNLKDKLPALSEEEQIRLLAQDGMLIKRPLIVTDKILFAGFKAENWAEVLK